MSEARAWSLLLSLSESARRGRARSPESLRQDSDGWIVARPEAPHGWAWAGGDGDPAAAQLFDLYLPLCLGAAAESLVIGHLAQSLDGRIATAGGRSQFISGPENLVHSHRLRALCDAVLVGRLTVQADDPRLTTRLVEGPSPTRVVIDPRRRLEPGRRLFGDGGAPTLLVCAEAGGERPGQAEVAVVEGREGALPVGAILAELRRRGLRRIFVEGGGVTVSRFLAAGALTRLQITVAPLIIGSGRPSFSLPVIDELSQATACSWRQFTMGRDVLFDCTLS